MTSAAPFPSDALAEAPVYCDVSLPVPLDQPFTYRLPETLRHRVQPGCRVLVPFGTRKLTGVVLATHDRAAARSRRAKRFACSMKSRPSTTSLLNLGRWIATYYCAPLGETLRAMTPLAGDIRRGQIYSLTTVRARRRAPVAPGLGTTTGRSRRDDSPHARRAAAFGVLPHTEN